MSKDRYVGKHHKAPRPITAVIAAAVLLGAATVSSELAPNSRTAVLSVSREVGDAVGSLVFPEGSINDTHPERLSEPTGDTPR